MNLANIQDFGAVNDDFTNNSVSIQKTIDYCAALGGGKVVIPAGKPYLSGPFNLKSNIELHLEHGAVLKAYPDESVYTKSAFRQNMGEGTIWIGGENLNQISLISLDFPLHFPLNPMRRRFNFQNRFFLRNVQPLKKILST